MTVITGTSEQLRDLAPEVGWTATPTGELHVVSEPLTYDRHAPASYLRDLALVERGGDQAAAGRLARHETEMRVELPKLEQRARQNTTGHGLEYRTNPNSISSTLAPPLWMIEYFATAPRAKRVLADRVQKFPLPAGVHSVNLPRLTTGDTAQPQQDGAATSSTNIVDATSQSVVTTISSHADTSLQLLEQSPPGAHLDWALFKDMTEAYDAQLELQLLNGTGTGENLLGILNASIPTANKITYTDSTPTGAEMLPFLAEAFANVGDSRSCPPECFLMRSARWSWFATQLSTGNNPLFLADWGPEGQGILSLQTFWDDAIPVTLGAGGNQDAILCVRPSDIMLWEGEPRTRVLLDVLSGTLQARFEFHQSVAAIIRYPSGQAIMTGTGMVIPTSY